MSPDGERPALLWEAGRLNRTDSPFAQRRLP